MGKFKVRDACEVVRESFWGGSRGYTRPAAKPLTVGLPSCPRQAPPAAEPHAGLLPAGEPAQHGERVHAHRGHL